MSNKKILIANGQGFWGDSILGPIRLLREGPLDYLTLDYLAEVTMSIMQKLKSRDPQKGYATDFVRLIERVAPELIEKDVKVITQEGHKCMLKMQVTDVKKPLMSVSRICDAGHRVVFEANGGSIEHKGTGQITRFDRVDNVYRLKVQCEKGFSRQGR